MKIHGLIHLNTKIINNQETSTGMCIDEDDFRAILSNKFFASTKGIPISPR